MAVFTTGDIMLVTVKNKLFEQVCLNTFHYRLMDCTGSPEYFAVIDEFHAKFYTAAGSMYDKLQACYPQNLTTPQIWYQKVYSLRTMKVVKSPNDPGLWPHDATSANVACVVERRGVLANRRNVGSIHIPCAADPATIDDGAPTPAYTTVLEAVATQINATITTALGTCTWRPVLFNYPDPIIYSEIINASVQDTSRVMRRRTVRVGE